MTSAHGRTQLSLQLGRTIPDFTAETTHGSIRFHHWLAGKWAVFFSHPKDFTPVCTTELGEAARLAPAFAARDSQVIGLSVDSLDRHAGWEVDIADTQGAHVNFPIVADADRAVARLYGRSRPR